MLACRVLKLLASQIRSAQSDWDRAAHVLSTIWALLHKGERVKATLKRLPDFMSAMRTCSDVVDTMAHALHDSRSSCTGNVNTLKQVLQSSRVVARVLDL